MKTKTKAIALALALSFAASTPVLAQSDRRGPPPQVQPQYGHDRFDHDDGHRRNDRAHVRPGHYERGQRLPAQYRGRQYVVENWRAHGLKAPPRGHRWVQAGGDYLLISTSNGIIRQVLIGR